MARFLAGLLLIVFGAPAAWGGDDVKLLLRDGRFIAGTLDSGTNDSRLWIHASDAGVTLRSGFAWHDIAAVVHESTRHTSDEFRKLVSQLYASEPEPVDEVIATTHLVDTAVSQRSSDFVMRADAIFLERPRVASLRVRGWAASWDADPELDGLLVEVTPLSQYGEFVPVEGQLSMTLIGEYSQGHPEQLRRFRPRYPEIARQSEQVHVADFFHGPAVYKLPYRNLVPEQRLDLFPQGVLTATLGVPGQGNFTASTDEISLIPASPIRDRRQQWFGRRYFPQELSRLR